MSIRSSFFLTSVSTVSSGGTDSRRNVQITPDANFAPYLSFTASVSPRFISRYFSFISTPIGSGRRSNSPRSNGSTLASPSAGSSAFVAIGLLAALLAGIQWFRRMGRPDLPLAFPASCAFRASSTAVGARRSSQPRPLVRQADFQANLPVAPRSSRPQYLRADAQNLSTSPLRSTTPTARRTSATPTRKCWPMSSRVITG